MSPDTPVGPISIKYVTPDRSTWADRFKRTKDVDGTLHYSDGEQTVTVLPDNEDVELYRQVLQQTTLDTASGIATPTGRAAVLVAKLNGVYVYMDRGSTIITTRKLL